MGSYYLFVFFLSIRATGVVGLGLKIINLVKVSRLYILVYLTILNHLWIKDHCIGLPQVPSLLQIFKCISEKKLWYQNTCTIKFFHYLHKSSVHFLFDQIVFFQDVFPKV